MTISGAITVADLARAIRVVMLRRARPLLIAYGALAALSVLTAVLAFLTLPNPWEGLLGYLLAAVALFLPLVYGLTWLISEISARQQIGSSKELAGPLTHTFSDEGIEMRTPVSSGSGSWEALHAAVETKTVFVLLRSKMAMQVIPKRHFSGPEEEGRLRELLRQKLGEKAKLRS